MKSERTNILGTIDKISITPWVQTGTLQGKLFVRNVTTLFRQVFANTYH